MDSPGEVGVATAVLDLVALRASGTAPVLDGLVRTVAQLLGVAAGAALISDGAVRGVVSAGDEQPRAALAAGFGQGPGGDCARSGRPVLCADLRSERPRWLSFVAKASAAGITGAWAVPVRRDAESLGALLMLGYRDRPPDLPAACLLAEAAAVGIVRSHEQDSAAQEIRQLRTALQTRITVEQAKGMLAASAEIDVDTAFAFLRGHARRNGRSLVDLADAVVRRDIDPTVVIQPG